MPKAVVLSPPQVRAVFSEARRRRFGERDELAMKLSFMAGLRCKEIAALKVGDVVDLKGRPLSQVRLTPDQTKGDKYETVRFNTQLQDAIRQYLKSRQCERSDPLLRSAQGGHISVDRMQHLFKEVFRQAGFENCSSHSGRRTFMTMMSRNGIETRLIQEAARHSSLAITQRYIDVSEDRMEAATETVRY